MIISTLKKTTKKQGLILSLKNTFLEKPESECQTEPPSLLRIKTHLFFINNPFLTLAPNIV